MLDLFVSTYPFCRDDLEPRKRIQSHPELHFSENPLAKKLTQSELMQFALNATSLIAGTEDLTALVQKSTRLKHISRVGIGLDSVPLFLCREKGIRVSYTPDAVTPAVAELALGMILSCLRHFTLSDSQIRKGKWIRNYGHRISKVKIGIIGFGRIGKALTRLLAPLSPQLLIHDIRSVEEEIQPWLEQGISIRSVSFQEILKESDLLTLHIPSYSLTKGILNRETFSQMKPGSFLVNTARGSLVVEKDLLDVLNSGHLSGAALDVFEKEPYSGPLTELENVLLTQHIGSCSYDCRNAMELQATEESLRFLLGKPLLREVPEEEYRI